MDRRNFLRLNAAVPAVVIMGCQKTDASDFPSAKQIVDGLCRILDDGEFISGLAVFDDSVVVGTLSGNIYPIAVAERAAKK